MITRYLVVVFSLLVWPTYVSAVINDQYLGEIQVIVEGADRTEQSLVEKLVDDCIERGGYQDWHLIDTDGMAQCVSNSRLYSDVRVQIHEPQITVLVTDRWTLIPIPYIHSGDSENNYGLFLLDTNFLGYGKTVGIGLGQSDDGNSLSLMYLDNAVNFSDYTLKLFALRSIDSEEAYDGDAIRYGYDRTEKIISLIPGYRFTPNFEAGLTFNYLERAYSQLASYSPLPDDYRSWAIGARVSYRPADYKLFYNDGFSGQLKWLSQVDRSDDLDLISTLTAELSWDKLILGKQALQLGLEVNYQINATAADVEMFGREQGYRGIESNGLWADRIAAISMDYQIPLYKWQAGTATIAPFIDFGIYQDYFDDNAANYLAYGIGAYYFLNLINVPGIGFVVGRNDEFMGSFVSFQIGMSFQ